MAAGRLPKPGSEVGPCEGECKHKDCAETRSMAGAICPICDKPVGYETRFYHSTGELVHAACLEDQIEAARARGVNV